MNNHAFDAHVALDLEPGWTCIPLPVGTFPLKPKTPGIVDSRWYWCWYRKQIAYKNPRPCCAAARDSVPTAAPLNQ